MEPGNPSNSAPVVIVSPDERWLRVHEITVRLGGYRAVTRRSVGDTLRVREGEEAPLATVFDLGDRWTADDLAGVSGMVADASGPVVVILPGRLASERDRVAAAGAAVVVRPFRPSELYALLPPVLQSKVPPVTAEAPDGPRRRRSARRPG